MSGLQDQPLGLRGAQGKGPSTSIAENLGPNERYSGVLGGLLKRYTRSVDYSSKEFLWFKLFAAYRCLEA